MSFCRARTSTWLPSRRVCDPVGHRSRCVEMRDSNTLSLDVIEQLVRSDYVNKDTMHDLTHIKRVYASAVRIAAVAQLPCDGDVLRLGAYLHGVVYVEARAVQLRDQLLQLGASPETVEHAMQGARESQTEGDAKSPEGIALHDSHLLEGGQSFVLVKSLVTGAAR